MRFKLKLLKRLISIVCVATITISSVSSSVGAFQGKPGEQLSFEDQQALNELNESLHGFIQGFNQVREKYDKLVGGFAKPYKGPVGKKRESLESQLKGIVSDLNRLNSAEMKGSVSFDAKKVAIDKYYNKMRENLGHILNVLDNCESTEEDGGFKLKTNSGAQINEKSELDEVVISEMKKQKCENDVWKYLNTKLNSVAVLVRRINAAWRDEQSSYSPFKENKTKKNEDGKRDREQKQDDLSDNKKKKTEEVVKPQKVEKQILDEADKLKSDTTSSEIDFGLRLLEGLPKRGDEKYLQRMIGFLQTPDPRQLNKKRLCEIKHRDGSIENVDVDEVSEYEKIKKEVENIKKNVNGDKTSKYSLLPKEMRITEAIYRWVFEHISFDDESVANDDGDKFFRKPQDAIFVYKKQTGLCEGMSNLISLMMRIASIPSENVGTIANVNGKAHAYTSVHWDGVYGRSDMPEGWTLLDVTWARNVYVDKSSKNKGGVESYFPGFYDYKLGLNEANRKMLSLPSHRVNAFLGLRSHEKSAEKKAYLKFDDIYYVLQGTEGNAHIRLTNFSDKVAENVKISPKVSSLPIKFKVLDGIKSLILEDDQIVDISEAFDLESINTDNSKKYIAKNEKLYERDEKGQPGKEIASFDKETREKRKIARKLFDDKVDLYSTGYRQFKEYLMNNKIDPGKVSIKHHRDAILKLKKELEENFDTREIDVQKLTYYTQLINHDMRALQQFIDDDQLLRIAK